MTSPDRVGAGEEYLLTAPERYSPDRTWSGTAAGNNANALPGTKNLRDTVGLGKQWSIVAVALRRSLKATELEIHAVDCERWGIKNFEQLQALAAEHDGSLPVTQFLMDVNSDLSTFLDQHFKSFTVVLQHESSVASRGHRVRITDRRELPAI